jgi:hypothetical protein
MTAAWRDVWSELYPLKVLRPAAMYREPTLKNPNSQ